MWIDPVLFVHSSAYGHLSCFFFFFFGYDKQCCREHFMYKFLCGHTFPFLSYIRRNWNYWSHMIAICLVAFWRTSGLFSIEAVPAVLSYLPTSKSIEVLISPSPHQQLLFVYRYPGRSEVSHLWFDLYFPYANDTEHLFMWILTICLSFENVCSKSFAVFFCLFEL